MLACAARYETGAPRPRVARTSEPFNHHHSCCACDRPFGGGGWIRVLSAGRGYGTSGDRSGGQRPFAVADQCAFLADAVTVVEPRLPGRVHRPLAWLGR